MSKEIKYPTSTRHWIAHNPDGSIMHMGTTEPNQVTTTGQDTLDSADTEEGLVTIIASKDANLFPDIPSQGEKCIEDKIYKYGTDKVKCIQGHTRTHYAPEQTPNLFLVIPTVQGYPVWEQPTYAEEAYMIGDTVTRNGVLYRSRINNNTTDPELYNDTDSPWNYWDKEPFDN